jgi:hypothetical protein
MAAQATGSYTPNTTYDAQTLLVALVDNTPIALNLSEQTVLGRLTGGDITALTASNIRTLLGITAAGAALIDDATAADQLTTLGAMSNADATVTYAKIQHVSATDKVLGRSTAGAGDIEEIACTIAGRNLLDDANAAAQLVTLGLTNVTAAELEYVHDVTSAIQTQLNSKANIAPTINAQTGTTYELVATDAGKLITFGNAAAITVTIPHHADVDIPIGTHIDCIQILAGKVTFGGAGVTINSKGGLKSIGAQWVGVTLVQTADDVWSLLGDLIA